MVSQTSRAGIGLPRGPSARALIVIAVAYVALSTADLDLGGAPLKTWVAVAALGAWAVQVRAWRGWRERFPLALPVLIIGVAVPVAGLAVAAGSRGDGSSLHYALQEASRFPFVLFYFPLADAGDERIWLRPVYALCLITVGLFAAYAVFGVDYGWSGQVGPFKGSISVQGGVFRGFMVSDVLLVPALAVVLAELKGRGPSPARVLAAALLIACAYLSHTRGIWLGICVAVVPIAPLAWAAGRPQSTRLAIQATIGAVVIAVLALSAVPTLAPHVVGLVTHAHELSTSDRVQEARQLWAGIRAHPLLGTGLGATLPSGFTLDPAGPWAFELTYMELAYHLGLVGLLVVLGPLAFALLRGLARTGAVAAADRDRAAAAFGALAGLLVAVAGNPYLTTSVGMLAIAIALALAAGVERRVLAR